jgi:serine/threonine-protein kinase
MSPEAVTEESVDARADIYALGCVAYWLLTGRLVFEAATPIKTALAHVREDPVAPSQRTEIEIPPPLERLVLACLEKDPGRRPQSANELASGLRALGITSAWTQERAREWWEIHQPTAAQQLGVEVISGST